MRGKRGRSALYIGCVHMPTDSTSVAADMGGLKMMYLALERRVKPKSIIEYVITDAQLWQYQGMCTVQ